jgi:hypothetical protein
MKKERKPCHLCTRVIALRHRVNRKWHYPHKCPHAKKCAAGTMMGAHTNWPAYCSECGQALKIRLASRKPPDLPVTSP